MRTQEQGARLLSPPVSILLALFMLGTSRWGSYLGVPGAPVYVGDIVLVLGAGQLVLALLLRQTSMASLTRAPLVLLLTLALLAYAGLRFAVDAELSTDALRDAAPYAYGLLALITFLLPVGSEAPWRPAIYAVLTVHALWSIALPLLPGFPWSLPTLGSDAILLVTRPDFDVAVMGIGAAFGLHDLLRGWGSRRLVDLYLVLFIGVNAVGATTQSTRAGLLSAMLAVSAVLLARLRSLAITRRDERAAPRRFRRPGLPVVRTALALAVLGVVIVATPTGSRLVEGFNDASSQSHGTIAVRETVWDDVVAFVVRSPERTAMGVGFGRNFIEESGSRNALEGSTYKNVRSPHNYLVGTLARLGVAGVLLAVLIIVLGWLMAGRRLRHDPGPVTLLAALVVLSIPVTAMLGVVLESPFGAMPYFWGIGHLAAVSVSRRARDTQNESCHVVEVPPVGAGHTIAQ